jgi:hypothetical protein
MKLNARVMDGPNGVIAVGDVTVGQVRDKKTAKRLLMFLRVAFGGAEAVLRCKQGDTFILEGEPCLYRYAVDPLVDVLPVVTVHVSGGQCRVDPQRTATPTPNSEIRPTSTQTSQIGPVALDGPDLCRL